MDVSRRGFLLGASAVLWTPDIWTPSRAAALSLALARSGSPEGTTLATTVVRGDGDGYVTLREGPGWPTVVRTELAQVRPDRDDRRRAIASIVHLTDIHLVDAQSPGRVEFLDAVASAFSGAFRPQETMSTHVQSSMVQRINQLRAGPITGRRFDCAVSTGDNIDNCQHNELDWFIGVLDGREITPDSGSTDGYEGVQSSAWADPRYWQPDGGSSDIYRDRGFPEIPGLLDAAIRPHTSPGLNIPWYSTYGNHDGLIQGNLPRTDAADQLLVADYKITDLPSGTNPVAFIAGVLSDPNALAAAVSGGQMTTRPITADPARRTVLTSEWVQAHLDSGADPGPAGHGYDESHLDGSALYYRFDIAPGVVGLSMDTGGYNSGAIRETQLQWLEEQLASVHSRSFDPAGNEVRSGVDDHVVLLFSHFTSETMTGAPTDPAHAGERTIQGDELVAFLHRWPNLVAWINGHTHTNDVRPMRDPSGRTGGFWQITTASHIDFPEQARIVELVDNDDGTMSIFTTMIEHAAPVSADHGDLSPLGLASISRELSANNDPRSIAGHLGPTDSLNTELALPAPFDLARAGIGATTTTEPEASDSSSSTTEEDGAPVGALLGGGAALVAGGVAAAIALRRRGQVSAGDPES